MSSTILDDYAAWLARPVVHQVPVWTFETFHSAKCRAQLVDPGARCVCRVWSAEEES